MPTKMDKDISGLTARVNTLYVEIEKVTVALDRAKRDADAAAQAVTRHTLQLDDLQKDLVPLKRKLKERLDADV